MGSLLTVDIFLSVDGWAGSDGLPGYFGYLGPELEEWITAELAAPQVVVMGRRTYEALAGYPDESRMTQLDKVVFSRTLQQVVWPNTRICDPEDEGRQRRSLAYHGKPFPGPAAHKGRLGGSAAADDLSLDRWDRRARCVLRGHGLRRP